MVKSIAELVKDKERARQDMLHRELFISEVRESLASKEADHSDRGHRIFNALRNFVQEVEGELMDNDRDETQELIEVWNAARKEFEPSEVEYYEEVKKKFVCIQAVLISLFMEEVRDE